MESSSPVVTLAAVRRNLRNALLPKFGDREATAISRAVLLHLKGWDLPTFMANEEREASDFIINSCREITSRLLQDTPLQYILGETTFYGLKIHVKPGVLIPRPETEELVDIIVKENRSRDDLRVLDLCTGSGAIALALSRNLPFSSVTAIDISPEAVAIARENASSLKAKISIRREDVFSFDPPADSYDIIVSNPPYVDESEKTGMEQNVLAYEPHIALFVPDSNPLLFYDRIADIGLSSLVGGGRLYFEINPRHATELVVLLETKGYRNVVLEKDVHGNFRFAKALKP